MLANNKSYYVCDKSFPEDLYSQRQWMRDSPTIPTTIDLNLGYNGQYMRRTTRNRIGDYESASGLWKPNHSEYLMI